MEAVARLAVLAVTLVCVMAIPQSKSNGCKLSTHGFDYVGNEAQTVNGRTCQRWDSQSPHSHSFTDPRRFPDDTMEEAGNKCRNPDREEIGPWCYTTDPSVRYEFCLVDGCHDFQECKWTEVGLEYRGSVNETRMGVPCADWDTVTGDTGNTSATDENFCRNPDGKPGGPWCYTADMTWDYCIVPFCKVSAPCKTSTLGKEYIGTLGITKTGRQCQRWNKQYPHSHPHSDASQFPDATLDDATNFCRNPDNEPEGPWCYTTDPNLRWEYCDVPTCQDCKVSPGGIEYSGVLAQTTGGRTCQRWDSQTPHPHNLTDQRRFPDASLSDAANYCRNPDDRSQGPWCFTTDGGVAWEYCDISECSGDPENTPIVPLAKHVIQIGIDGLHPCFINSSTGAVNITQRIGGQGIYTLTLARTVVKSVSGPGWTANLCGMDVETSGIRGNGWTPPWMGGNEALTPSTGVNIPLPCGMSAIKGQDSNIRTAGFYDWSFLSYHMNFGNPGVADREVYCRPVGGAAGYVACDITLADDAVEYLRDVLTSAYKSYTFLYLGGLDEVGHANGWCGTQYMGQVDAADAQVGQVLDLLDELGVADQVFIALTTDHGGQGTSHGREADSDVIIPLYMRGPGIKQGHQFEAVVRNYDIVPTIAHVLGLKQNPWWSGRVLSEAFT